MEYYIALRDGSKGGDESAANALIELQPYAVIAAEQALGRKDFTEAERLRKLVADADPQAPSLARIASAITRGLLADTQAFRADKPATGAVESLVAAGPAKAPTGTSVELVAVRTPQPDYPADKRQKGAVGQVVASFTVNSDGTVGEVRTESIGLRHISFERSVAQTVKRWKYQPPGESRNVTQSFSFAP